MSWFSKISGVFNKRKLDNAALEELESLLITSDIGVEATSRIINTISAEKFDKEITDDELKQILAKELAAILEQNTKSLEVTAKPAIILMVGVNGNGKTTSAGKLAYYFKQQGKKVLLVAADTFRAAAVEQLTAWAERANVEILTGLQNQDPASLVFKAAEKALTENFDVVLVDTAGRLQNKTNLMAELAKISAVCKKIIPESPHEVIMVLDATTGQNALSQTEEFSNACNVSGLIITKLDGTAKGGVVIALSQKFQVPVYAIGTGEGIGDLKPFVATDFTQAMIK